MALEGARTEVQACKGICFKLKYLQGGKQHGLLAVLALHCAVQTAVLDVATHGALVEPGRAALVRTRVFGEVARREMSL